jgi:hypothetical protein
MLDYDGAGIKNDLEKIHATSDGKGEKEAAVRVFGEPRVVHVDQELDYRVTVLAPDFETWIKQLRVAEDFAVGAGDEPSDDDDVEEVEEK